ncbi:MAG: YciI family protein [bacterium]
MKFMLLVKASEQSEAGVMPTTEQFTEMGKFNEEMVNAGVMLAAEGLQASAKGARIQFDDDKKTVVDGPFAETKELIAGFWIIQVRSKEEAVQWAMRAPNPHFGGKTNIEVRQVFSPEDFGASLTPELIEHEGKMREQVKQQQKG